MKHYLVLLFVFVLLLTSCDVPTVTPTQSPLPTISPLATPEQAANRVIGERKLAKGDSVMTFWNAVLDFFYTSMLPTILGLVVLDVVFGIAASLKEGAFDWSKVAQFYKTMVAPYVLVYLAVFVALALVPDLEEYVTVVGISVATLFGSVTANLLASIVKNVAKLGVGSA